MIRQATALLNGDGLPPDEADEGRTRLLAGFRWILVDEYQDVGPDEYDLISALAGRTLPDEHDKLSLFAVGDDDQNIYAFNGSSTEFIRRFEADYHARVSHLTDNYRSTGHIIAAANAVIEPAPPAHEIRSSHHHRPMARRLDPLGGSWTMLDPVAQGRVQILPAGDSPITQAQVAVPSYSACPLLIQNGTGRSARSSPGSGATSIRRAASASWRESRCNWPTRSSPACGACARPGPCSAG